MLRALLVDDEIAALRSLELLLKEFCTNVEVVGKARSVREAVDQIITLNPDIVFLDIEMPEGNGFELFDLAPNLEFHVIFVTAFNQYAVRAFKYSAIDYLLKPVDIDELISAVGKVNELIDQKVSPRENYSILFENIKGILPKKLVIPQGNTYSYIDLEKVLFIVISKEVTTFFMTDETEVSYPELKLNLPSLLKERGFHLASPDTLVNLAKVSKVDKFDKGRVVLENNRSIPFDVIRKEDFIEKLVCYNQEKETRGF